MPKVILLGAGPTALAVLDGLSEQPDLEFIVIEANSMIGGLATTLDWQEHGSHDLGPHKIFSLNETVWARVRSLLPKEAWITQDKKAKIYMRGQFLNYPPAITQLLKIFDLRTFIYSGFGFVGTMLFKSRKPPESFEEDIIQRVGKGLYEFIFKPIATKLWGDPKFLDVKLSKSRVQTPSIRELFFRSRKTPSQFEAHTFDYPKGGLQNIWKAIEKKVEGKVTFRLGCRVERMIVEGKKVKAIEYFDSKAQQTHRLTVDEKDFIFSSIPLANLATAMRETVGESLVAYIEQNLVLNDLYLVFFKLKQSELFSYSWTFVPDAQIAFHRVSEQKSFDPGMTPTGTIVCCEIMGNEERKNTGLEDAELIRQSKEGLERMTKQEIKVEAARVIRLPESYPVYRTGYKEANQKVLSVLDGFENIRTIGRQGTFNYIGTLDCMDIGYGAASWYRGRTISNEHMLWQTERSRTEFFPILD